MTRRLPSLHLTPQALLVAVGGLGLVTITVTLLARDMKVGLALMGALVFVPVAIVNTPLALCGWLITAFLNGYSAIGSAQHRSLLFIMGVWIALAAGRNLPKVASWRRTRHVGFVVMFLTWMALTLVWAPDPSFGSTAMLHLATAVLVFFLVLTFCTEPKHVRWLMTAFVIGAVLSILSGAITGGLQTSSAATTASSSEGRLQGGTSDPNYLAAAIVPAMIFAGALASRRGLPLVRFLFMAAAAVLAFGLAATESRGGFLAVTIVSIAALATWKGRRRAIAAFIGVFILGAAAWFIASPSSWHRVTHADDGGSGRADIWQVAWRVVEAHPVVGVGLAQFPVVSPNYILRPGALSRADLLVGKKIVVHNAYLQLWVETGIVGLLLLLAVAAAAILASRAALLRFDARGDPELATLARAVALALVGALAASFFLSNIDDQRLWVLLALGPVLLGIAQRADRGELSAA
jgi:O-antigen ligase